MADYTYPLMLAQNALRLVHESIQNNDYNAALRHAYDALAETKLTCSLVKDMADQIKYKQI
jgi:cellobiose-specific phosphotransferase system component IIA